jgi:hypothetical protein
LEVRQKLEEKAREPIPVGDLLDLNFEDVLKKRKKMMGYE